MKKIFLILALVIAVFCSACGEKTEYKNKNISSSDSYTETEDQVENERKTLSRNDIFETFKNKYCNSNLTKRNDVLYTSANDTKEIKYDSDSVVYTDLDENIMVGVYFRGNNALTEGQQLRIKVIDAFLSQRPVDDENKVFDILSEFIKTANIDCEFPISQIKSNFTLKDSLFAMKTYKSEYSNNKFTLEVCYDNNGDKIIARHLYCDFHSVVYKTE